MDLFDLKNNIDIYNLKHLMKNNYNSKVICFAINNNLFRLDLVYYLFKYLANIIIENDKRANIDMINSGFDFSNNTDDNRCIYLYFSIEITLNQSIYDILYYNSYEINFFGHNYKKSITNCCVNLTDERIKKIIETGGL